MTSLLLLCIIATTDVVDTLAVCGDSAVVVVINYDSLDCPDTRMQFHDFYNGRLVHWHNNRAHLQFWRTCPFQGEWYDTTIIRRYTPPLPPPTAKQIILDWIRRNRNPHSAPYWKNVKVIKGEEL